MTSQLDFYLRYYQISICFWRPEVNIMFKWYKSYLLYKYYESYLPYHLILFLIDTTVADLSSNMKLLGYLSSLPFPRA